VKSVEFKPKQDRSICYLAADPSPPWKTRPLYTYWQPRRPSQLYKSFPCGDLGLSLIRNCGPRVTAHEIQFRSNTTYSVCDDVTNTASPPGTTPFIAMIGDVPYCHYYNIIYSPRKKTGGFHCNIGKT